MASDLIGAMLGPYEVVEFLGLQGIAEVYRGRRAENGHAVLIRLAGRGLPADPVWSARFRREAKAIAALRHVNIAPAYDFGEALEGHYMVTDFPEDSTLADVLAQVKSGNRTISSDDLTFVIRQIAAGLDHAHTRGVVHRDVSPAHMMITRSGQVILADFGLALLLTRGADDNAGGAAFAMPEYLAPEVLADFRAASPASDIYSLGMVLYEMLTGDLPFRPSGDVNPALRVIAGTTPDPRLRNSNVPPPVAAVVVRALAESPKDRFKNTMHLAEALETGYRYPHGKPRRSTTAEATESDEDTRASQPTIPLRRRPTAERIVVKRGPSLQDERREKARLRAELRAIQDEEKRQNRQERQRIRQARARAFWRRWGPALALLAGFLVFASGAVVALQALGVISIAFAPPASPAAIGGGQSPAKGGATASPTITLTPVPTATPILSPTPIPQDAATPIPPVVFTPLDVGVSAYRVADGAAMQFVPAGQFLMGTNDPTRSPYARPQHPVMLSDYWIDRTEVANVQYGLCVGAGVCRPPSNRRFFDDPIYTDYPVVFTDYTSAAEYCLWVAKQTGQVVGLPTEAQWEKAAAWDPATNSPRTYPWGNSSPNPKLMRYQAGNEDRPASPVGSHPMGASAYGALDMAGNVWEWVADWFDPNYYERTGIAVDPTGPLTGSKRVTRGGSWRDDPLLTMSNVRNPAEPNVSGDSLGFRCAMTAGRPPSESSILLTPLDVTQALNGLLSDVASDPANDRGALATDVSALIDLTQGLQSGDHARALTSIAMLQSQLADQQKAKQVSPGLAWRVERALLWIEGEFPPAEIPTPALTATP